MRRGSWILRDRVHINPVCVILRSWKDFIKYSKDSGRLEVCMAMSTIKALAAPIVQAKSDQRIE